METIISKMEQAAQWWEQLLSTTGGKLELSKYFFYLMYWTFDNEGIAHTIQPTDLNQDISLIDSKTKETVTINVLATSESHKTLGVVACPGGKYEEENIRIEKKISGFAQRVACIHHLPEWEQKLLHLFEFIHPIQTIINIFNKETKEGYKVNDKGCSSYLGSFGWIVSNQSMHVIQGQGVAPGGLMSSHRAEGFGKLAWVTLINCFTEFFKYRPK
jgi:hypothetical protein